MSSLAGTECDATYFFAGTNFAAAYFFFGDAVCDAAYFFAGTSFDAAYLSLGNAAFEMLQTCWYSISNIAGLQHHGTTCDAADHFVGTICDPAYFFLVLHTSSLVMQGVMLTHSNLLYQLNNLNHFLQPVAGESSLSLLPPWHIYERSCGYFIYSCGLKQVYTNIRRFREDLTKFPPQFFVCVPLVIDTLQTKVNCLFWCLHCRSLEGFLIMTAKNF